MSSTAIGDDRFGPEPEAHVSDAPTDNDAHESFASSDGSFGVPNVGVPTIDVPTVVVPTVDGPISSVPMIA
ncbi:MAG TPA: hypothetical protein PLP95_13650, partial [Microthrixaceae bacterium]|nr:hypothetical protein [Microthrixaceae bacterium]